MKKVTNNNDKDRKSKHKTPKTPHLGNFGFKFKKKNNG